MVEDDHQNSPWIHRMPRQDPGICILTNHHVIRVVLAHRQGWGTLELEFFSLIFPDFYPDFYVIWLSSDCECG